MAATQQAAHGEPVSLLTHLACARCGNEADANKPQGVCTRCAGPLYARYDLEAGKTRVSALSFGGRNASMWRYAELLPLRDARRIVTLGEGSTPFLHLARLGERLGFRSLLLKDEGRNPTGTFKARGIACAVSRNHELGVTRFAVPTAGNAGGALATYAAAAGAQAFVAMPRDAPAMNRLEVELAGAELALVDGTIADASRLVQERCARDGWFDASTLKEPYRLEGNKTLGFEIAEALGWTLPDVIVYPTGGGEGLLGMWKAFEELDVLGLIGTRRPRLVAVQPEGCAPIVRAFRQGHEAATTWESPATVAAGLRVPKPFADREILQALRASRGTAVAVSDDAIRAARRELAATEGVNACPEGAATLAGLRTLVQDGWIESKETVVLLNTGTGLKYP